jgi:hypothetical protein
LGVAVACGLALLLAVPAAGHHFVPRESDATVTIVGTVAKFEMVNPHSRLLLVVGEEAAVGTMWEIELGSVMALVNRGWKRDLLKPGDRVTVEAIPWKGRANAAVAREIGIPDGRRLFAGSHAGDYPPRR